MDGAVCGGAEGVYEKRGGAVSDGGGIASHLSKVVDRRGHTDHPAECTEVIGERIDGAVGGCAEGMEDVGDTRVGISNYLSRRVDTVGRAVRPSESAEISEFVQLD